MPTVWITLKLNAEQVSDETVLAHIPNFKKMLHIFFCDRCTICTVHLTSWHVLFAGIICWQASYIIGYWEKCVTMKIYPKNCIVPLPALTNVWNWALRPQHSDWVLKIRQINFTNVILRKTVCSNFGPSHLLYFRDPWQGLDSLPSCSTETLLPSLRLSSSRAALLLLTQDGWSQKEPLETEGQLQGLLRAASRWVPCISNWGHSTTCSSLSPSAGTGSRKGGAIVAELRSCSLPVAAPRKKGRTQ